MSRCFPPSVFQFGRDHLGWSLESPGGRERMSVDLLLLLLVQSYTSDRSHLQHNGVVPLATPAGEQLNRWR